MSQLLHSFAALLRRFAADRRTDPRRKEAGAARLPFRAELLGAQPGRGSRERLPVLEGHTRDISARGLALIVPSAHIREEYLRAEGRTLRITLELPTGPIVIHAEPVRYRQLDENNPAAGYLIGVRLTDISDGDNERFTRYLRRIRFPGRTHAPLLFCWPSVPGTRRWPAAAFPPGFRQSSHTAASHGN